MPPLLRSRLPLGGLLVAAGFMLAGGTMASIMVPWFVLDATGSAASVGLVGFTGALPIFVSGIVGGALIDRVGRRQVAIAGDALWALSAAAIPAIDRLWGIEIWQVMALVFLGQVLTLPALSARRTMLPEVAAAAGMPLERANALHETLFSATGLIAPPLAGVAIAAFGVRAALWIPAAVAVVAVVTTVTTLPRPARAAAATPERLLPAIAAGWRFLRGAPLLYALVVFLAALNLVETPLYGVILPVYASDVWGDASSLGIVVAANGAGALVGGLAYGAFGSRLSRRTLWIAGYLGLPLPLLIIGLGPGLPVIVVVMFVVGLLFGPVMPVLLTVRHERIPSALRGRVLATFSAVASLGIPPGLLLTGALVERIGLATTSVLMGIAALLATLVLLALPVLREMDERPTVGLDASR